MAAAAVSRLAFALVAAPVSLALGFAAATVSFTAWNIMVPLLLNGFGLSIPTALFVSVMLDVFNSATLTLLYGYHGKVDWWYGVYFGSVSAAVAAVVSNVLKGVVQGHQSALSGMMFVFPFLLSAGFCYKGAVVWRRRREQRRYELAMSTQDEAGSFTAPIGDEDEAMNGTELQLDAIVTDKPIVEPADQQHQQQMAQAPAPAAVVDRRRASVSSTTSSGSTGRRSNGFTPRPSKLSQVTGDDGDEHWDMSTSTLDQDTDAILKEQDSTRARQRRGKPTLLDMSVLGGTAASLLSPIAEVVSVPPLEHQHVPLLVQSFSNPIESNPIELPDAEDYAATVTQSWAQRVAKRFKTEKVILTRELGSFHLRVSLMGTFSMIMGALSGSLFIGGGMMFALATASLFRTNVRLATGTGAFICCITMVAASFAFVQGDELATGQPADSMYLVSDLAYYLLICVPCGILGAVAGVRLSLRISDTAIFFFISAVLFSLGVFIAVQSQINASLQGP